MGLIGTHAVHPGLSCVKVSLDQDRTPQGIRDMSTCHWLLVTTKFGHVTRPHVCPTLGSHAADGGVCLHVCTRRWLGLETMFVVSSEPLQLTVDPELSDSGRIWTELPTDEIFRVSLEKTRLWTLSLIDPTALIRKTVFILLTLIIVIPIAIL